MIFVGVRMPLSILGALTAATFVCIQTFWLIPSLDARVSLIIAGQQPPPSYQHDFYIAVEVAKAVALVIVAGLMVQKLRRVTIFACEPTTALRSAIDLDHLGIGRGPKSP